MEQTRLEGRVAGRGGAVVCADGAFSGLEGFGAVYGIAVEPGFRWCGF